MFDSFADTSRRYIIRWRGGGGGGEGGKRTRYLPRVMCVYACNVARTHSPNMSKKETARRNMNHEPLTHLRIRRAAPACDAHRSIHFVRPLPSLHQHVRNNFEKPRRRCRVYKKGFEKDGPIGRVVKKSLALGVSRDIRLNITRSRLFSP